jgi:gas vesicle protein
MFFSELKEYFQRQRETERRKEACRNIASGAAIGTIIGLPARILFAPKSGKETRQAIADKAVEKSGQVKQIVSEVVEELKSQVGSMELSVQGVTGRLQEAIQDKRGREKRQEEAPVEVTE